MNSHNSPCQLRDFCKPCTCRHAEHRPDDDRASHVEERERRDAAAAMRRRSTNPTPSDR